ncbi:fatty acid desaturase family protein [Pseudooceanicola batsensis HTCC2597]|uniref:Fatty acid desaturase family protein n=1 Tax=Pseudooceanicola batsensis (strain ATCC BAA-863 / DSM 15984 / KCTC 12145 / HTCC2597) TaxID=252305 RepID=A3U1Y3_PSEBH|nr:fatty acid desaturase [Pseudooceanicola batsensis]EAQ01917.1 fatty acid desaturase family protein [Pseudooceanicola batsensis HTCC2597]
MRRTEWPTLALIGLTYAAIAVGTTTLAVWSLPTAVLLTGVAISLHGSLCHEVIHGHPFRNRRLNEVLVGPAVGLIVPYLRFRDTHLAHHRDENLTDPYDDPESNFWDPAVWHRMARWQKAVMRANNTLAGRMILGPAIGTLCFIRLDWRAARAGDRGVARGWLWHIPALVPVVLWLALVAEMPVWAYLLAAYLAHALQKIRTFLEHRAHERARGRTVIVEDRGPLAWLFLNNNLHVVHHAHPNRPWYELPALYARHRERFLRRNDGYRYRSYAQIFRSHFLRAKDQVPHPLWQPRAE